MLFGRVSIDILGVVVRQQKPLGVKLWATTQLPPFKNYTVNYCAFVGLLIFHESTKQLYTKLNYYFLEHSLFVVLYGSPLSRGSFLFQGRINIVAKALGQQENSARINIISTCHPISRILSSKMLGKLLLDGH